MSDDGQREQEERERERERERITDGCSVPLHLTPWPGLSEPSSPAAWEQGLGFFFFFFFSCKPIRAACMHSLSRDPCLSLHAIIRVMICCYRPADKVCSNLTNLVTRLGRRILCNLYQSCGLTEILDAWASTARSPSGEPAVRVLHHGKWQTPRSL
jgi:hypothetical protein